MSYMVKTRKSRRQVFLLNKKMYFYTTLNCTYIVGNVEISYSCYTFNQWKSVFCGVALQMNVVVNNLNELAENIIVFHTL